MELSVEETKMLAGERGEAVAFAMRVLVRIGDLFGAPRLFPISSAHVDGTCYQTAGDAGLDFAEKMQAFGAKVVVPTTTNVTGRDRLQWREFRQPEELSEKCRRMEEAYLAIGAEPTWTCAPYLTESAPKNGDQVVWAESNAIAYGNSVIGIRTHRYGDFMDVCAAITGRAPFFGLHLEENRRPSVVVELEGFGPESADDTALFGLLGYHLGLRLGSRIPYVRGAPPQVTKDCLKALSAAGAASGSLALFHVEGVTPEAGGYAPWADSGRLERIVVRLPELHDLKTELCTTADLRVDLVAVGCPHGSFEEAARFAAALGGRAKSSQVECFFFTNQSVLAKVRKEGIAKALERSGVRIATDTCILHWDLSRWGFAAMGTCSAKFAKYAPSCLGLKVRYGSLEHCAAAVLSGEMPS